MTHPLITVFENAGQEHVFKYWNELSPPEQSALLKQAREFDLGEISYLNDTIIQSSGAGKQDFSGLRPAPYIPHPSQGGDQHCWDEAATIGESALRAGRVAAFVVAGGQGTRLGYDKPKGLFPVTPIKEKSLFQVFAEKIKSAQNKYQTSIPWFIMTSQINHDDTVAFFGERDHFGLSPEQVNFFRQGRMPAVDFNGKILLSSKGSIAMSPDGHGGSLRALVRSGATKIMAKNNIDFLSYFQVDNPLIKVIDPAFIGFHIQCGAGMSSKMIPKAYAEEKIGVFCIQNDKTLVIEYSDLPEDLMHAKDPDGNLRFFSGSIAIHILSRSFIEQMGGAGNSSHNLPFHRANKKIPTLDAAGKSFIPDSPNGVKFEMFVFDALPFSKETVVVETQRATDFSPVKNKEGLDSPQTSAQDQMKEFVSWLEAAGETVAKAENGVPIQPIEVSPLFAYDEATFIQAWKSLTEKPDLTQPLYLQ